MSISIGRKNSRVAITFAAFVAVLAGSLGMGVEAAEAAECDGPASVCATLNTAASSSPKPSEREQGDPCNASLPANPVTFCGKANFVHSVIKVGTAVSGLPQDNWLGFSNQYSGQCKASSYQAWDPAEGKYLLYKTTGVGWTDKRYWTPEVKQFLENRVVTVSRAPSTFKNVTTTTGTGKNKKTTTKRVETLGAIIPQTVTVYELIDNTGVQQNRVQTKTFTQLGANRYGYAKVIFNPRWMARTVTYAPCYYPNPPRLIVNDCPTEVGPGTLTGPTGNSVTKFPVATGPGKYDPKTEKRVWRTKPAKTGKNWRDTAQGGIMYSTIGLKWQEPGAAKLFATKDSPVALSYARGCDNKIEYNTTAINQPCQYLGTTFPEKRGMWLSASDPLCKGFVPGNYYKEADGKQSKCQYVQYFWNIEPRSPIASYSERFIKCDPPKDCADCAVQAWAHWKCNDATGSNGRNSTYDFVNCGVPGGPNGDSGGPLGARCTVPSKAPQVFDPTGAVMPNGSQAIANGKAWQIRWQIPQATVPVKDKWMQWIMASNSSPHRSGMGMGDPSQPVFASDSKTANPLSASTMLTQPGTATGKAGWNSADVYLRAYLGSNVNTSGSTLSVGSERTDGGLKVGPNQMAPYGLYIAFLYTYDYTTSTGMGGPVTITIPVTCGTDMAYLYWISGRVSQ